jgi:hypothetical protein
MVDFVNAARELIIAIGQLGPFGIAALALLVALSAVHKGGRP